MSEKPSNTNGQRMKRGFTIILAILIISAIQFSIIAIGQSSVFDDFEDGSTADWNELSTTDPISASQEQAIEGSWSGKMIDDETGRAEAEISKPSLLDTYSNITYWFYVGQYGPSSPPNYHLARYKDGNTIIFDMAINGNKDLECGINGPSLGAIFEDTWYRIKINQTSYGGGNYDCHLYLANGDHLGSGTNPVSGTGSGIDTMFFQVDNADTGSTIIYFDYIVADDPNDGVPLNTLSGYVKNQNGNPISGANITHNQTATTIQTDVNGFYNFTLESGIYNVSASADFYRDNFTIVNLSTSKSNQNITLTSQFESQSRSLELEFSNFMRPNETQSYKVIYVVNNSASIVTNQATTFSSNTTVAKINGSTIESANISLNDTVTIETSYQNLTTSRNLTVGVLTINNIDIMPSNQWLNSFISIDSAQAEWGIGSEIQWIFLAIFIGGSAAWLARNEWLGIGGITGSLALFWVLDHVSLGILLVSVTYGIFALYQLTDTPSRSDTNVGSNLNK